MFDIDVEILNDFLKKKKEILCEFFISFHCEDVLKEFYKEESCGEESYNFEDFKKKYFEERFDLIEKLEIDLFWKLKGYSLDYDYEVDYDHNLLGLKITFFLKYRKKDNILFNFKKIKKILGGRIDSQYINDEGILTYNIYELNQVTHYIHCIELYFSEVINE